MSGHPDTFTLTAPEGWALGPHTALVLSTQTGTNPVLENLLKEDKKV